MKILHITYALNSGGAERFLTDLGNEQVGRAGIEVTLLSTDDDSIPKNRHYLPDVDKRVKYICIGAKSGLSLKSLWGVYKTIRKEKPDVVHAHCSLITLFLPALLYRKSKYVHTLHSLAPVCLNSPKLKSVFKFFYKHFIVPVTISRICRESYEELYTLKNAAQIDNGRSPVSPTDKAKDVAAEIKNLFPEGKIFINVARCHPLKNHKLLLETFASLPNLNLIVIGNGFAETDLMRYNEYPNIKILGEKSNVGDYLAVSDYFILSSDYEGLPISLLEAMSMGLIPVSTPVGGMVDVIADGVNGYLSPSMNPADFKATVVRAAENPSAITPESIVNAYKAKYSMTGCADRYLELYNKLLNTK